MEPQPNPECEATSDLGERGPQIPEEDFHSAASSPVVIAHLLELSSHLKV